MKNAVNLFRTLAFNLIHRQKCTSLWICTGWTIETRLNRKECVVKSKKKKGAGISFIVMEMVCILCKCTAAHYRDVPNASKHFDSSLIPISFMSIISFGVSSCIKMATANTLYTHTEAQKVCVRSSEHWMAFCNMSILVKCRLHFNIIRCDMF